MAKTGQVWQLSLRIAGGDAHTRAHISEVLDEGHLTSPQLKELEALTKASLRMKRV